jgi:uncharacterized protein (TIGR02001 family)
MKKLLATAAFAAMALSPNIAKADSAINYDDIDFSANVGLFSEYVFRGITQSDESLALQGGFDVSHINGLYAGIWGSNVDFNDGDEAHLEIDIYAGYSGAVENFSYDFGVIYYAYPGAENELDYDFWETALSVGYDFDIFSASASINYSPDYFGDSDDAFYYAAGIDIPVTENIGFSTHIGFQEIDKNSEFGVEDYIDWSVGLSYSVADFDISLQYIDTDLDEPSECADGCDTRFVLGISKSF